MSNPFGVDLFDPNVNFADFHHVKADEKQPKEHYFVPFCRVLVVYALNSGKKVNLQRDKSLQNDDQRTGVN